MVNNGTSSHKSNYIDLFFKILNLEGHQNRCIGSKVTVILLNEWILPTVGAACGRVCTLHVKQLLEINKIKVSSPSCLFFWQLHISNQMQQLLRTQSWYKARNSCWLNKEMNCSTMEVSAERRRFSI